MPVDLEISEESLSLLACPQTRASLEVDPESGLTTTDGGHTYAVRHGVASFLSRQTWDSPHPAHRRRLIEVARADGYQQAFETVLDNPAHVTSTSRMPYLDLLDLRSDSRVLEIGASLGQHTRAIAKRCGRLEALEVIPEQKLARLREDQELLSSGRATRVLLTKIPFRAKLWFAPSLVFLAGKADRT